MGLAVPFMAQRLMNSTKIHEDASLIPGFDQWIQGSGVAGRCGVGLRRGLDLA